MRQFCRAKLSGFYRDICIQREEVNKFISCTVFVYGTGYIPRFLTKKSPD